ncbi:MAG TPA: response regulator [Vitreimonas sp.]|uniref:response regulator n=1 Tax=Vitreimonas sp. TaxID=3069702 RepID=UPI002D763654|nr:response regulator [Vitreimonas sp.]HYD86911.1 response regulator [Vitreimonas sp.]
MRGLEGLSVLVVDDHPQMRKLVASLLRGFGFRQVQQADTCQKAWSVLQASAIDLVLLDAGTFERGAADLVQKIRRDPRARRQDIPVIWMSAFTDRQRVFAARDAGVSELLVKPISSGALFDRIVCVIDKPRPFVSATVYVGPDRRRRPQTFAGRCRRSRSFGR